jgi:Ni/Co efflux regulator RcnB
MKTRVRSTCLCALVALSMTTGGLAAAQGRDDRGGNAPGRSGQAHGRSAPPARDDRRDDWRDGRDAGPPQGYRTGQRLPSAHRAPRYVVNDWRGHHLSAPPRGMHWVQSGGDYLLVAVATGVIVQLLLDR